MAIAAEHFKTVGHNCGFKMRQMRHSPRDQPFLKFSGPSSQNFDSVLCFTCEFSYQICILIFARYNYSRFAIVATSGGKVRSSTHALLCVKRRSTLMYVLQCTYYDVRTITSSCTVSRCLYIFPLRKYT